MNTGGAQSIVREYARLIDYSQFTMTVVTIYPAESGANMEILETTECGRDAIYKRHNLASKLHFRFCSVKSKSMLLLSVIKKRKTQVIHVHTGMLKYLLPIRKELSGVKLLYTCHSIPSRYFTGSNADEMEAAKILVKENDLQLIALHNEMRLELNKMFGVSNTVVIHNGIDFGLYRNLRESKAEIRRSIGVPGGKFLIGHIGRFSPEKNHSFLIKIFAELVKLRPESHLLLVGQGVLKEEVMKQIETLGLSRKVTHLQNRADIPRLICSMDVFVFPSIYEGLPVSVVEAQVAGIRCVASDRVTDECFFLPSVVVKSIDDTALSWAEVIADENVVGNYKKDISEFDMRKEIKKIEQLYK